MTHIAKPRVRHPALAKNRLGLTRRDYEGSMSTLCAGCGHDSITAAIVQAFWEMDVEPHKVVKTSGIGCSGKTPAYFLKEAHGLNAVHGRMPSITTGAHAANRELVCVGVSGDGDSLSIGIGQFAHVIRRNVDMLYILENNGVYGLTKGQFSASADVGSKAKRGEVNREHPIDPVLLALNLGAGFVARSFSGDKEQLVPILQAGLRHRGLALVDVISPCVTFNDHRGSTKSYEHTRNQYRPLVEAEFRPPGDDPTREDGRVAPVDVVLQDDGAPPADLVPPAEEITASYGAGDLRTVVMHDGSRVRFRKVPDDYDPFDRDRVYAYIRRRQEAGEIATGLLYLEAPSDPNGDADRATPQAANDFHGIQGTVDEPLVELPFKTLCPGADVLERIQRNFR